MSGSSTPPFPAARQVSSFNDYSKDRQFAALNRQRDVIEVTVVRGGAEVRVHNTQVRRRRRRRHGGGGVAAGGGEGRGKEGRKDGPAIKSGRGGPQTKACRHARRCSSFLELSMTHTQNTHTHTHTRT